MSSRIIYAADPAKGWQPWGALVPVLGIVFVAITVISLTAVLQRAHLVDADENPIGLLGFVIYLLMPFTALGLIVLAGVRFVERRSLAAIGLGSSHRTRVLLCGHLIGVAMAIVVVAGIWFAGSFTAGAYGIALHSPGGLARIFG